MLPIGLLNHNLFSLPRVATLDESSRVDTELVDSTADIAIDSTIRLDSTATRRSTKHELSMTASPRSTSSALRAV